MVSGSITVNVDSVEVAAGLEESAVGKELAGGALGVVEDGEGADLRGVEVEEHGVRVAIVRTTVLNLVTAVCIDAMLAFATTTGQVCYGLEHYICFVYNRAKENWIVYDDDKVKVIGSWDGVLPMCSRELLQPQILLFEVNGSVPVTPLEETKEPDNPREAQKAERKRSSNHGKAKQDMDLGDEHPFSHPLQRQI
ncbi:Inactive ubiquitin carboxyl-terminal hydrolase 53 [Camellia lanceoleosa]|uniref:Inactive ubiquitin carboxyl-terminal hydrolase 53 n=1 Tax=Camellia lanceoleosa TaxID=1840588 RepID=A0ACC0J5Q1_9ERIC|nr:Inactive ubiquitin carboxyl-terminal hydrolase 53 [Camellia lanceoleosa]